MSRFISIVGLLIATGTAHAEPWISNRYAQNCAGCHAPARLNVMPKDRRCTLSCQGCHVNPQGGGLRSSYGIWNQRRWLRSFFTDRLLTEKKRPAPLRNQLYAPQATGRTPQNLGTPAPVGGDDDDLAALTAMAGGGAKAPTKTAAPTRVPRNGFPTVVWERNDYDEREYDRSDGSEKMIVSREEFLQRVTADDPYREERRMSVMGGGDLRFIALAPTSGRTGIDVWLMAVDFGLRFRPVPENFRLVFEGRYMAGPTQKALDQAFTSLPRIRSAYVLIDDLPYNSYFQYGLYRPMFGNYDGDHLSLSSKISGLDQNALFLAASVGASPNVPFINFSYIRPISGAGYDKSKGFVVTLGARWVTLGASMGISYWDTTSDDAAGVVGRKMFALTGGAKLGQFLINGEFLYVKRESAGVTDAGSTITIQGRYKLWREIYGEATFATSNTSPNLKPGDSQQYSLGLRGFLTSGLDLQTYYFSRRFTEAGTPGGYDGLQSQLHLYF